MGVPARRWSTRADLHRLLEQARVWLDTTPLDEASVAGAAEHCGLAVHHFIRTFGEVYGRTPHRYLTERRLARSKELLNDPSMTVGEVAVEVGFRSPSAFARLFRSETGVTPIQYRRSRS